MDSIYSLGIDLGTTSVKVCLFNKITNTFVFHHKAVHNAYVTNLPEGWKEQNPVSIFKALLRCLEKLKSNSLPSASEICISGQMHGVMLWKRNKLPQAISKEQPNSDSYMLQELLFSKFEFSNLITWEDQRCDHGFLEKLPKSNIISRPISSGYGCASLFWLKQYYGHQYLSKWEHSGTIMDFLSSALCSKGDGSFYMSAQNAYSWGYFDSRKEEWEGELLQSYGFPTQLLPEIKTLTTDMQLVNFSNMPAISKGAIVIGSFGDLQCTVFSLVQDNLKCGAINVGTSSQFAIPIERHFRTSSNKVDCVPYFGSKMLLTASSLNGGNVIELHCKTLLTWLNELQISHTYTLNSLLEKFLSLSCSFDDMSTLNIKPTIFGERYETSLCGSINSIRPSIVSLTEMKSKIHVGILNNLVSMMPEEILSNMECICTSDDCQIEEEVFKFCFMNQRFKDLQFSRIKETGAEFGAAKLCSLLSKS